MVDEMQWMDFLAHVDTLDEIAREQAKEQARGRMANGQ